MWLLAVGYVYVNDCREVYLVSSLKQGEQPDPKGKPPTIQMHNFLSLSTYVPTSDI